MRYIIPVTGIVNNLILSIMLKRLEGLLSDLLNFTNSAKIFHFIKDFNLNIKNISKSSSFQNLLQLILLHIKSKLEFEKNKFNNNYMYNVNRRHVDSISLE